MKKSIFAIAAVTAALTLSVCAMPTSAAESKAQFTEITGIGQFPTDTAISSDNNNFDTVYKYLTVDAGPEQQAKDGQWDAKIVEIEGKKSLEFDAKSITSGLYLQTNVTTSVLGDKKGSLPLGMRAQNDAETLNIEFDASDCNDNNPYVSFVIWEYAKDASGKGFGDSDNKSFSVAFWKMKPGTTVTLTDNQGTETTEVCDNQNIGFPKGFKGYATIKTSDLQLDWGSATYNASKGCTTFMGDNITQVSVVTSLNKDGGQLRVGGFYLGYNGYKPGMADAEEVKMIKAKHPKEACDNADFIVKEPDPEPAPEPTPDTSTPDDKTDAPVVDDNKTDTPVANNGSTGTTTKPSTSTTNTTTKTETPKTGDAGVVAMAAVLMAAAGAAVVVAKRK